MKRVYVIEGQKYMYWYKLAQIFDSYLDMLEFKHISLYKGFLNLLTCPCNK